MLKGLFTFSGYKCDNVSSGVNKGSGSKRVEVKYIKTITPDHYPKKQLLGISVILGFKTFDPLKSKTESITPHFLTMHRIFVPPRSTKRGTYSERTKLPSLFQRTVILFFLDVRNTHVMLNLSTLVNYQTTYCITVEHETWQQSTS